jgi:hypothetical protein
VWPPGERFYDLARQSNRSANVHQQSASKAQTESSMNQDQPGCNS